VLPELTFILTAAATSGGFSPGGSVLRSSWRPRARSPSVSSPPRGAGRAVGLRTVFADYARPGIRRAPPRRAGSRELLRWRDAGRLPGASLRVLQHELDLKENSLRRPEGREESPSWTR
jgi:hypothetical protein